MMEVFDPTGNKIKGLYKNPDGSIITRDINLFNKSKLQKDNFDALNSEVSELKHQMAEIMKLLGNRDIK